MQILNNSDIKSQLITVKLGALPALEILVVARLLAAEATCVDVLLLLVLTRVVRGPVLKVLVAERAGLLVSHRTGQGVLPPSVLLVGHALAFVHASHGVTASDCIRDALRRLAELVRRALWL